MDNFCNGCNRLLRDGDHVTTRIESVYHALKSKIAYALDKDQIQVLEPLIHRDCNLPKGMPED